MSRYQIGDTLMVPKNMLDEKGQFLDPQLKCIGKPYYNDVADRVSIAMRIERKPCTGQGCDDDNACEVHKDIPLQVEQTLKDKL